LLGFGLKQRRATDAESDEAGVATGPGAGTSRLATTRATGPESTTDAAVGASDTDDTGIRGAPDGSGDVDLPDEENEGEVDAPANDDSGGVDVPDEDDGEMDVPADSDDEEEVGLPDEDDQGEVDVLDDESDPTEGG